MLAFEKYFNKVQDILSYILKTEKHNILLAANAASETLLNKGLIFTFGTGHSHMLAEEIFYRAGGLVRVYPILDEGLMLHNGAFKSTSMERIENYSSVLAEHHPLKSGDTIFIFSNSGRNAATVEMAIKAKQLNLTVIAITSLNHTNMVDSRHSSKLKLCDVADIVIDNGGCQGDAAISIGDMMVGPTSTVLGASILQAIVCQIVDGFYQAGEEIEVFRSSNLDHADKHNQKYIDIYKNQIRNLF